MSARRGVTNSRGAVAPGQMTRREFVRLAGFGAAAGLVPALAGCDSALGNSSWALRSATKTFLSAFQPLKAGAGDKNILFGAAAGQWALQADPAFATQIATHAGLLVPENELKWETVEPQPDTFNFTPGDWLADFATQHGQKFRGHTLVWHQQLPTWAGVGVTGAEAAQQLTNHIAKTVVHYAGRMHSWDVVNEAINPRDGRADYLRNTVWLQTIGPDYIDLAFRTAAAADPAAVLVYNDYGMEYDGSDADARRAGILQLLTRLKAAGTPVHALGIQAHLDPGITSFDAGKLVTFIRAVADLGLKIFITELDVIDQRLPADVATRDSEVAGVYAEFLGAALQDPAVTTVLTWGLSDRYTWLSNFRPRSDGLPVRPLPLDSSFQAKPALYAMLDAFQAAAPRPAS